MVRVRQRVGRVLMAVGAVLVAAAAGLLLYNQHESARAAHASQEAYSRLEAVVCEASAPADNEPYEMPVVNIDGYDYIGYLQIPVLGLDLPVMDTWDYDRLTVAPCRQFGTVRGNDLVIAGHNYASHFGGLSNLKPGDTVSFTDVDGRTCHYEVRAIEILEPTAAEAVRTSPWDLVLYTCTYGGRQRVVVQCARVDGYGL